MQVFLNFFLGAGNDQKARARSGEGSGEVWRVDIKKGWGGGDWVGNGEGAMGRGRRAKRRGRREGETGRGMTGGGDGKGGNREGGKRGGQAHRMPG